MLALAAACTSTSSTAHGTHPSGSSGKPGTDSASPVPGTSNTAVVGELGAKWDWARVNEFTPYLSQLKGGSTFYEAVWCKIEPQRGQRSWADLDRVVTMSARLGYTLMLKVRTGTCWATGGRGGHFRGSKQKSASAFPADLAAYRDFVDALVTRYAARGVHEYAIENEVNGQSMWDGTPQQYVALVRTASAVIRRADPRAVVADAGISSTAYGVAIADRLLRQGAVAEAVAAYQRYYSRRETRRAEFPAVHDGADLRAALAGSGARRDLEFLKATEQLAADGIVSVRQVHFYERWDNVPALVAYLGATTPRSVAIECWETGIFSRSTRLAPQTVADEMTKTVTQLLAGGVRRVIWLPLAFDPTGRHSNEPRYGLLDPNGATRPIGKAFLALSRFAHGQIQVIADGALRGAAIESAKTTYLVLWSSSGDVRLAPRGGISAGATTGASVSAKSAVTVGQSPVIVTVARPLSTALRLIAQSAASAAVGGS